GTQLCGQFLTAERFVRSGGDVTDEHAVGEFHRRGLFRGRRTREHLHRNAPPSHRASALGDIDVHTTRTPGTRLFQRGGVHGHDSHPARWPVQRSRHPKLLIARRHAYPVRGVGRCCSANCRNTESNSSVRSMNGRCPTSDMQRSSAPYIFPAVRSEEHTSELQSRFDLVCRLLLEKKKTT